MLAPNNLTTIKVVYLMLFERIFNELIWTWTDYKINRVIILTFFLHLHVPVSLLVRDPRYRQPLQSYTQLHDGCQCSTMRCLTWWARPPTSVSAGLRNLRGPSNRSFPVRTRVWARCRWEIEWSSCHITSWKKGKGKLIWKSDENFFTNLVNLLNIRFLCLDCKNCHK